MSQAAPNSRRPAVILLVVLLTALGVWAGANAYVRRSVVERKDHVLDVYGLNRPTINKLAAIYKDANGDLVADAPTDANQLLTPSTIKFNYLAAEQEQYEKTWAPFLSYLSERLGRPVEYKSFESPDDQLLAIKAGEVHIAGLNAGAVPMAVDACGFVPVASFGAANELATYTMQIIVPGGSRIKEIEDIGGRMLALTDPTSNSGCKAPLMMLWQKFQLIPVRDFDVVYSGGHAKSIRGIASGKYELAAVASDELDRLVARGEIKRDGYRVLHTSKPFCNNTFGVPHRMDPKLAQEIAAAFVEFPWEGTEIAKEFSKIGADSFRPVDYKVDFKQIRDVDDGMGRRHEMAEQTAATADSKG